MIEPFSPEALGSVSYDLTLGGEIARYRIDEREGFNPAANDPADMFKIEGASTRAATAGEAGFWLRAGERVLAHSREIAGGRQVKCPDCAGTGRVHLWPPRPYAKTLRCKNCHAAGSFAVTTQLHATSTLARIGLQSCGCAGFGDVGFLSPWVFEITNMAPRALFLPVGAVVAQVEFSEVEPILDGTSYEKIGTYQKGATDPVELLKTWRLKDGLPRRLKVRA